MTDIINKIYNCETKAFWFIPCISLVTGGYSFFFFFFFLLHFGGEKAAFLFPTYCNQMNNRVTNDACMHYGSLTLTTIAVTTVTYYNERNIKVTNTKEAKRRDSDPH